FCSPVVLRRPIPERGYRPNLILLRRRWWRRFWRWRHGRARTRILRRGGQGGRGGTVRRRLTARRGWTCLGLVSKFLGGDRIALRVVIAGVRKHVSVGVETPIADVVKVNAFRMRWVGHHAVHRRVLVFRHPAEEHSLRGIEIVVDDP